MGGRKENTEPQDEDVRAQNLTVMKPNDSEIDTKKVEQLTKKIQNKMNQEILHQMTV